MADCNLNGCRRQHYDNDAVKSLAEKLHVNVLLLQFKRLYKFLIEMNVNICNELSKCKLYLVAFKVNMNPELARDPV